jgi:hypothetical protein
MPSNYVYEHVLTSLQAPKMTRLSTGASSNWTVEN